MQIDYTAKRSLKPGHTVDTGYTINVNLSKSNRLFKNVGDVAVSLNGNTVTTVHRYNEGYVLTTVMIQNVGTPDNDDMVEFLDSVSSGETFTTDITGATESFILEKAYTRNRSGPLDIFRYNFTIRKL